MCCGKKPSSSLKRTRSGLKKRLQGFESPKPAILPKNQEETYSTPTTPPYGVQKL